MFNEKSVGGLLPALSSRVALVVGVLDRQGRRDVQLHNLTLHEWDDTDTALAAIAK